MYSSIQQDKKVFIKILNFIKQPNYMINTNNSLLINIKKIIIYTIQEVVLINKIILIYKNMAKYNKIN